MDNPYFDKLVVTFAAELSMNEAYDQLSSVHALPGWGHVVVVLPNEVYRVIYVDRFRVIYEASTERFRQNPLSALADHDLVPVRLLELYSVEQMAPERLIQLALEEPSRIFLVGDAGLIIGRIWDPERGGFEMPMHAANGGSGSGVAEEPAEEKRTISTYPIIASEDHAYLGETFTVRVQLSSQPQQETGGHLSTPEFIVVIERDVESIPVEITLYASDFSLAPEDVEKNWDRNTMLIVKTLSSDEVVFNLQAEDRLLPRYFSTLQLTFRIADVVVGQALRRVEVLQDRATQPTATADFPPILFAVDADRNFTTTPSENPRLRMPASGERPVDLTVSIRQSDDRADLLWVMEAPALGVSGRRIGKSANLSADNWVRKYLGEFIRQADRAAPAPGELHWQDIPAFFGVLINLRDAAPGEFWSVYSEALKAHSEEGKPAETFTILFQTEDPHLPWELMPVSRETDEDGNPPQLLGSAHRIGRWLLGLEDGSPRPELNLQGMAVVVPDYEKTLPGTQAMKEFAKRWHGRPVGVREDDTFDSRIFYEFMSTGRPTNGAGILHYAGHGDCCKDLGKLVWLVLSDDQEDVYDYNAANSPLSNRFSARDRDVLIFFNACTTGQAVETGLGSVASWSRAMLCRGYDSFIGPLWYVDDIYARTVAELFYTLSIGDDPLPLGEVMRQIRSKYMDNLEQFTYLAYSYYGHPDARVVFTPF